MARRRVKKRTHPGAKAAPAAKQDGRTLSTQTIPKTMVIRIGAGEVGPSVSQLVRDVRSVMEPHTASRLKERKGNKLRDYQTMAGPLGVSHLLLFSRSESGNTNLRIAMTPRGPTLHFRVEKYSLSKDVRKALKRPKGGGKEFLNPPLLVMNNFVTQQTPAEKTPSQRIPKHLESLTTSIFQSLFPAILPQSTSLSSIRRVLLLNREISNTAGEEDESYILNFRHYAITTKASGLSRPLRRLNAAEKLINTQSTTNSRKGGLPNLSKLDDIADYMIGGENGEGYRTDNGSGSEVETDAEVEVLENVTRKVLSSKARQRLRQASDRPNDHESSGMSEKRAVKLVELGPRMRLRMTKVEEGVCGGKVMWHEYISKSKEEIQKMDQMWDKRRKEREERRKVQRENVERKKKERGNKGGKDDKTDDADGMDVDEWDSADLDSDAEMGDQDGWEDET